MIAVHHLGHEQLHWDSNDRVLVQHPVYRCGEGTYPRTIDVDPTPCYHHDLQLVRDYAEKCWHAFPLINARSNLYVLSHEYTARNNGIAFEDHSYSDPATGQPWPNIKLKHPSTGRIGDASDGPQALTICLAGKRIPPLPSMTRYLVTHEYGHLAFYRTKHLLGYGNNDYPLYEQYMRLRGWDGTKIQGPNRWHQRWSEIFANDFRILLLDTEAEFWPHDVPHPSMLDATTRYGLLTWFKEAAALAATGTYDPACVVPAEAK